MPYFWLSTNLFLEKLCQYPDELVINQACALQTRILQSLDLLLDNKLERGSADKERRGRAGRVVQDGSNVGILDIIERVHRFDSVGIQLVEHKTDTRTSGKLCTGKFLVVTLQNCTVLVAELGDGVENDVSAVSKQRFAQLGKLGLVFGQRYLDTGLDLWERVFDVHHENLARSG